MSAEKFTEDPLKTADMVGLVAIFNGLIDDDVLLFDAVMRHATNGREFWLEKYPDVSASFDMIVRVLEPRVSRDPFGGVLSEIERRSNPEAR